MKATGRNQRAARRGAVLIYTTMTMLAFVGFCSLGVDWGRVQLVKTELQTAADAAARAGAGGLGTDSASAYSMAKWTAAQNKADGKAVDLDVTRDIELGVWDKKAKTYTKASDPTKANAVRVIARRTAARGTAVSLSLASAIGFNAFDVEVEAIAWLIPEVNVNQKIDATANPFLAGMPAGTVASLNNPHNSPDYAGDASNPRSSPQTVNLPLEDDEYLTFDSIDGTARHDPNLPFFNPDGELGDIGHNTNAAEHGISDMNCPINALIGVFLDDRQPDATKTPKKLDFTSAASRDFDELKPKLKQTFFIGDGLNDKGQRQKFIVPKGATRLYLATWDFYEWNNNYGWRVVKVNRPRQIVLVK